MVIDVHKVFSFKLFYLFIPNLHGESPHGIEANLLDSDIVISKFKLQLCYYIHFQTNALLG